MTTNPFTEMSGTHDPKFDFAFEFAIDFSKAEMVPDTPGGYGRGFISIDSGTSAGSLLNGTVISDTGGDYAFFRPDEVLQGDARYILQADEGTRILMHNRA